MTANPASQGLQYCHPCRLAYPAGTQHCSQCGGALRDTPPPADNSSSPAQQQAAPAASPPSDAAAPLHSTADAQPASDPPLHAEHPPEAPAAPAADRQAAVHCGVCGESLPPQARFCAACGHAVDGHATPGGLCLVAVESGQTLALSEQPATVGKNDDNDLPLDRDLYVSRRHLQVHVQDGQVVAEDLGSSNGTFLRLKAATPLAEGDELVVGKTVLRVERR